MVEFPKVYMVVLCNNSGRWLKTCIDSALKTAYENLTVLLVDNASTDGSVEAIEKDYPQVTVLRNSENLGWCLGNNVAIRYALDHGADYIYLSNADVRFFQPQWLSLLMAFVRENPRYGVVGPLQYCYDNAGEYNDWTTYILENGNRDVHYMWSDRIQTQGKQYNYTQADMNKPVLDVAFVQGSAMLVSAELFRKIGLFDPMYFIFYDELDFCRRALRTGTGVGLVPGSAVQHFGSGDCSRDRKQQRRRNFYFSRNKYYYVLADYSMESAIKKEILRKWLANDFKQSFVKNSDVSDVFQWLRIACQLLLHGKDCRKKSRREQAQEQRLRQGIPGIEK